MCIGSSVLTEMMYKCPDFIDNKTIKLSDVDLSIIACNGGAKVKNILQPSNALTRPQMIEVIVRLANDKYIKNGACKTLSEAVKLAWENNFEPYFSTFDAQEFRDDKLWREEIDVLLTRFQTGMQIVFQKNVGKLAAPGLARVPMCLDEFVNMFAEAGLIDERFGQREIGPHFSLAMMTNVRETESERHLNMTHLEFLEALARCADRFELSALGDFFPSSRSKNPAELDKKMESICIRLMQRFVPEKLYDPIFQKYKELLDLE